MADLKQKGETPDAGGEKSQGNEMTFDTWLNGQDESVKALLETHTGGLRSALETERTQRKELAKQLRELSKSTEEGSQAREALEAMSGKLETYEQQVAAYDALSAAGVTNLKLAWIAAREAGAIDKAGNVNVESLRKDYPELFRGKAAATPPGNAGAGTGQPPAASSGDIDELIRRKAGRR